MMKHLRIENGIVREVMIAPTLPPFHPDIAKQWVSVPETDPAQEGWVWDGVKATDPKTLRTLVDAQAEKKAELKAAYEAALAAGYTCSNGIKMDSTFESIQMLNNGVLLSQKMNLSVMDIRDYNNTIHSNVPINEVESMIIEIGKFIQSMLSKKWLLQEQVDKSTTIGEIDAIQW